MFTHLLSVWFDITCDYANCICVLYLSYVHEWHLLVHPPTFLPTCLSTVYISSTSSPASPVPPCFLWPGAEGLEVSPHHSRVLFPLEAAVGCLLIWSEILDLDLAATYKQRWPRNDELWSSSYSVVYRRDRLPAITLQSALAVCGTVPVLTFPHFGSVSLWRKTSCCVINGSQIPLRCPEDVFDFLAAWMGNLSVSGRGLGFTTGTG